MIQASNSRFGWRLCSLLALVAIIFASLFLPPQLEQLRSGHWEVEHFFAYLAAVPILFLGWPRPFLVAAVLIPAAVLLEVLQCLRPDHTPNPMTALSSIGGVLLGCLTAAFLIRELDRRRSSRRGSTDVSGAHTTDLS